MVPKYNFKCNDCDFRIEVSMPMSKLSAYNKLCPSCGSQIEQHIPSFSSKVKVSKEEMVANAKSEARQLADKVRKGDQKLISQIYGEK